MFSVTCIFSYEMGNHKGIKGNKSVSEHVRVCVCL